MVALVPLARDQNVVAMTSVFQQPSTLHLHGEKGSEMNSWDLSNHADALIYVSYEEHAHLGIGTLKQSGTLSN